MLREYDQGQEPHLIFLSLTILTIFDQIPTDVGICCSFNFDTDALKPDVPMNKDLLKARDSLPVITSKNDSLWDYDLRPAPGYKKGLQVLRHRNQAESSPISSLNTVA